MSADTKNLLRTLVIGVVVAVIANLIVRALIRKRDDKGQPVSDKFLGQFFLDGSLAFDGLSVTD